MRTSFELYLALLLLLLPTIGHAQADKQAEQECDTLAASPYDLTRPANAPGVLPDKIDAPRAQAACQRAIENRPAMRTYFQLGRALQAGNADAKAVANYRIAADQGYALAEVNLGYMYEMGRGVTKDEVQAADWYRKAAEQGNAIGQKNLGAMYESGHGVAKDYAQAIRWYSEAAEQGFAPAQVNLGHMYENGWRFEGRFPGGALVSQGCGARKCGSTSPLRLDV